MPSARSRSRPPRAGSSSRSADRTTTGGSDRAEDDLPERRVTGEEVVRGGSVPEERSAAQSLVDCLDVLVQLASPIDPSAATAPINRRRLNSFSLAMTRFLSFTIMRDYLLRSPIDRHKITKGIRPKELTSVLIGGESARSPSPLTISLISCQTLFLNLKRGLQNASDSLKEHRRTPHMRKSMSNLRMDKAFWQQH